MEKETKLLRFETDKGYIDYFFEDNSQIYMKQLRTYEQGLGHGSEVLKEFIIFSKTQCSQLMLEAAFESKNYYSSKYNEREGRKHLIGFYEKNGFKTAKYSFS